MQKENVIKELTFEFGVDIIRLYKSLVAKREYVLSKQILRSGTSIGANVREAMNAHSRKDFVYKLGISLREASETEYWLDLLERTNLLDLKTHKLYSVKVILIIKILTKIIVTTKKNSKIYKNRGIGKN